MRLIWLSIHKILTNSLQRCGNLGAGPGISSPEERVVDCLSHMMVGIVGRRLRRKTVSQKVNWEGLDLQYLHLIQKWFMLWSKPPVASY